MEMSMLTAQYMGCGRLPSDTLLIVIDMQKDFVTGPLGTLEAKRMLPRLVQKLAISKGECWYTLDTHDLSYLKTEEGKHLPVQHCIKGSEGHELVDELKPYLQNCRSFEKSTFASLRMAKALLDRKDIARVELVGVCTDICVVSNALLIKAFRPDIHIVVDSNCCAGTTEKNHMAALQTLQSCQIEVI
ncbi:MAG: cysteine hydrolase [Sphaerochaeta sp.]